MAKKQLPTWGTKVTPEQDELLQALANAIGIESSELVRRALKLLIESHGATWPEADMKHGGERKGAGRKPNPKKL